MRPAVPDGATARRSIPNSHARARTAGDAMGRSEDRASGVVPSMRLGTSAAGVVTGRATSGSGEALGGGPFAGDSVRSSAEGQVADGDRAAAAAVVAVAASVSM